MNLLCARQGSKPLSFHCQIFGTSRAHSKFMKADLKVVLVALLVAALFQIPLGACASNISLSQAPSHPCCPSKPVSLPNDCARPGCIYMDTQAVPVAPEVSTNYTPFFESCPAAILDQYPTVAFFPTGNAALVTYERCIVFHQFLI